MAPLDDDLRRILQETKVIALVGWSPKPERPSHRVANYLVRQGYLVIPVNPGQSGKVAPWGEVVRAALSEIEGPVDMIDIFRRSEAVPTVVDEALMELEVGAATGAGFGEKSPSRLGQRNGYRDRDWVEEDQEMVRGTISPTRAGRDGRVAHPEAADGLVFPGFPRTPPDGREGSDGGDPGGLCSRHFDAIRR